MGNFFYCCLSFLKVSSYNNHILIFKLKKMEKIKNIKLNNNRRNKTKFFQQLKNLEITKSRYFKKI